MAEIELATLTRQCLNRKIPNLPTLPTLQSQVSAWNNNRNNAQTKIDWHFTTADARIKLKRLYPVIDN